MVRSSPLQVGDAKRDESPDHTFLTSTQHQSQNSALPQLKTKLQCKEFMNNKSLMSISDRSIVGKSMNPMNKTTID